MSTNTKRWTPEEEEALMKFVGKEPNRKAMEMFAQEYNRTWNAVQFRYYTYRHMYFKDEPAPTPLQKPAKEQVAEPENHGAKGYRPWSAEDERNLVQYVQEQKSWEDIANLLGRGEDACKQRIRLINRDKEEQKEKIASQVKVTRTPLKQYIEQHPEQFQAPAEVLAPREALTPVSEIHTLNIISGQIIRIPIISMSIENTKEGNNLLIQL